MPSIKDKRISEFRTICQVHRDIYDLLLNENIDSDVANKLIDLLDDAYIMAKKMNNKLRQYKHNYDDDWWEKNRKFKRVLKRRKIK